MSLTRGKKFALAFGVLALAAGAAFGIRAWRTQQRLAALAAALPARPDLVGQPAALVTRLAAAEARVRRGEVPLEFAAELASLYHANGFLAEAAACYTALLAAAPDEPRWPHRLAGIYAGFGQLDAAVLLWQRALALQPDYTPAQIRLGDALLKLNRDADATRAYEALLAREPDNPYALLGLARLDLKVDRAAMARDRLERALRVSNGAIGYDLLVTVCEQLGDRDRAAEIRGATKSSGAYYDPPDAWTDEIFFDCHDRYRVRIAAGVAEHSGDIPTARRLYNHALELDPRDAQTFLEYGLFDLHQQDLSAARRHFEQALALNPRLSDAWAQLVVIHTTQGDAASAARALADGLAHCPDSPGLHLENARHLAAQNRFPDAIAEFRNSYRLRPSEAGALFELATLLLRLDHTEEAVREIRRALEVEPDYPIGLMTLAFYSIGTGDETAARQWLQRCRDQPRVRRDQFAALIEKFQDRFGHAPW